MTAPYTILKWIKLEMEMASIQEVQVLGDATISNMLVSKSWWREGRSPGVTPKVKWKSICHKSQFWKWRQNKTVYCWPVRLAWWILGSRKGYLKLLGEKWLKMIPYTNLWSQLHVHAFAWTHSHTLKHIWTCLHTYNTLTEITVSLRNWV